MFSGKGGVTHNMLDDIHNHWRRAEAVRVKCLGVATLDMDNICYHLEVVMCCHMLNKTGPSHLLNSIIYQVLMRAHHFAG